MPYSVRGFFEIDEDMVQILLVLEVLFTQDSEVEDLFCGASSRSEPSLFFSNYLFTEVGIMKKETKMNHVCLVEIFHVNGLEILRVKWSCNLTSQLK